MNERKESKLNERKALNKIKEKKDIWKSERKRWWGNE